WAGGGRGGRRDGHPRPARRPRRARHLAPPTRARSAASGAARGRGPRPGRGAVHDGADGSRDARLLPGSAMTGGDRRLTRLVAKFPGVRVLVVGDLMLDQFIWGRVQRISPEAPVPVVEVRDEDVRPGGAGNVASNIAALGGRTAVSGIVGRDEAGEHLRRTLRKLGAVTDGLIVSRQGQTIQKTRIIAHHQQVVRLDRERSDGIDGASARGVRDFVLSNRRRFDVLVVSDYGKGAIGPELLGALAEVHQHAPFTWLVDPKRVNFPHYRR